MGSFNTTCAISHTPITPGDKVRLFFLASTHFAYKFDPLRNSISKGCQCYPWDDFRVIGGLSLVAEYADYNNYEFDENTIFAKYILSIIHDKYVQNVSEEGEKYNPYHDHMDVPVESLDWEKVQNMIHSGRLFLKGYGNGNLPFVASMAIHESVYQIMMAEKYETYVNKGESYSYETLDFETILKEDLKKNSNPQIGYDKKYNELLKIFQEKVGEDYTQENAEKSAKRMTEFHMDTEGDNTYEYEFSLNRKSPINGIRDFIANIKDSNDITVYEHSDIITATSAAKFFNARMQAHNFMYRPLMTSGQESDLAQDSMFWNKVSKAILSIENSYSEDYLETQKYSIQWQEINVSTIRDKISNWYSADDDEFIEFNESLDDCLAGHSIGDKISIKAEHLKDYKYNFFDEILQNKELDLIINYDI